eukprot:442778_1
MDSVHFYLCHCYDIGIRTKAEGTEPREESNEEEKNNNDKYFDAAFSKLNEMVTKRHSVTKPFERFSTTKNNKFAIKLKESENETNDETTGLDEIYLGLKIQKVSNTNIRKLQQFILCQEYETDTFEYDLALRGGNISQWIQNYDAMEKIQNFLSSTKYSVTSFSIGLRFYYWDYYKTIKQLGSDEDWWKYNFNDHSGYAVHDLFITPRYNSFKEEISNYRYISFKEYADLVVVKVNIYMISKMAKQSCVPHDPMYRDSVIPYRKHYGKKEGDPMMFSYLLALVLHCDFSDLCTDFNTTFRKVSRFEALGSVKSRHQMYYWFAKYLREVVECYGRCSYGDSRGNFVDQETGYDNNISGPFYTGMSVVLKMSGFNMRLCSPTSVSMHIEVATKFAGREGMILQLNNSSAATYRYLRGFDVSWISVYKEENERLFVGGYYYMKLESVRIRDTKQNFEEFVHRLHYLDNMLTGGRQRNDKLDTRDISMMKRLLNNDFTSIDNYICDTFATFLQSKKCIILDLHELSYVDHTIRNLIMHDLDESNDKREDNDVTNLLRTELLMKFENVQTVIIISTHPLGTISYSLGMISLLQMIKSASLDRVIVKAETYCGHNWIKSLWDSEQEILTKKYQIVEYYISMQLLNKGMECQFEITKM